MNFRGDGDMQELEGGEMEVGIVVNTVLIYKIFQKKLAPTLGSSPLPVFLALGNLISSLGLCGPLNSCVLTHTVTHITKLS